MTVFVYIQSSKSRSVKLNADTSIVASIFPVCAGNFCFFGIRLLVLFKSGASSVRGDEKSR